MSEREITGQHAIPPPPPMPGALEHALEERIIERIAARDRGLLGKTVAGVSIPLVVAAVIGAFVFYAESGAREAQTAAQIRGLEDRLQRVEERTEAIDGLRRDVAALSARVEAWRQSDSASWERRLQRIEDALDRRR